MVGEGYSLAESSVIARAMFHVRLPPYVSAARSAGKTSSVLLTVAFALVALAACANEPPTASKDTRPVKQAPAPSLVGTLWVWQETLMSDGARITPQAPERYTIEFLSEWRVQLRVDCNRGRGSYETGDDGRITLGPIATTKMLCPRDSQDTEFLNGLANVGSYKIASADELWLMIKFDSGTMRFRGVPR